MNFLDELALLGDQEIEYDKLSDDILAQLALGDDLFIANSALSELTIRKSINTISVAQQILDESYADCYLLAAALQSLFKMSPAQAVGYIKSYAARGDAYINNSIAELMMENESYFNNTATTAINGTSKTVEDHQLNGSYAQPKLKIHAHAI